MPGIVLQTEATDIVNKGGGYPTKTVKHVWKDNMGRTHRGKEFLIASQKNKGSDYIIFNCPKCQKRNKQCIYMAKGQTADGRLSFKCNGCRIEVEVARPSPKIQTIIVPGIDPPKSIHLLDASGRPIK